MVKDIAILLLFTLLFNVCYSQKIDKEIVIINVANNDRHEIAKVISEINSNYKPKVISVDIIFDSTEENDNELVKSLKETKNLVMATRLDDIGQGVILVIGGAPKFYPPHSKQGFSNLLLEDDFLNSCSKFYIKSESKFQINNEYNFAVMTAMSFDSLKTSKFIREHQNVVDIDFKDGSRFFLKCSSDEIIGGLIPKRILKSKIILIVTIGQDGGIVIPVSQKGSDVRRRMESIEIQANIIAQILEY